MAQKRISRHRFLKNITVTCTCSGLFAHPISARYAVEKTGKSDASAGKTNMEYRRLGRTGLKVSALSFGVMRLTEPAVLFEALDMGINYFDTAHVYHSGGILGHAFFDKGLSCDYHIKGKKVTAFIAFLPSVRDAVRSVKRHKTFLKQSEKKYLPLEEFGKHSFISEEPYHQKIIVIQEGARVIGVYDLNDVEEGKTLLADILRKIKQTTAKQK